MDKELIEIRVGKKVVLFLKNGFRIEGTILRCYTTSFEFDDRYKGIKGFLYEDIAEIGEVSE